MARGEFSKAHANRLNVASGIELYGNSWSHTPNVAVIERGLATFVEVGRALLAIRDERLYRETHKMFADYCRERWGMTKSRANQLIAASGIELNDNNCCQIPNEAVARELATGWEAKTTAA